jgi:hypothetical protein
MEFRTTEHESRRGVLVGDGEREGNRGVKMMEVCNAHV